jgi:hypothetical protein
VSCSASTPATEQANRAWRTLRGIDEQVAKAARAVAGLAPVKRNRFIKLDGTAKTVNRELEAKARDLAGLQGYVTTHQILHICNAGFIYRLMSRMLYRDRYGSEAADFAEQPCLRLMTGSRTDG